MKFGEILDEIATVIGIIMIAAGIIMIAVAIFAPIWITGGSLFTEYMSRRRERKERKLLRRRARTAEHLYKKGYITFNEMREMKDPPPGVDIGNIITAAADRYSPEDK